MRVCMCPDPYRMGKWRRRDYGVTTPPRGILSPSSPPQCLSHKHTHPLVIKRKIKIYILLGPERLTSCPVYFYSLVNCLTVIKYTSPCDAYANILLTQRRPSPRFVKHVESLPPRELATLGLCLLQRFRLGGVCRESLCSSWGKKIKE